jgi:choline-sulfatase
MLRRIAWPLTTLSVAAMILLGFLGVRELSTRRAGAARMVRPSGPNILIIIGDDHAADTLGVEGDRHGATPRIDALAKQGVYFTRAYCNAPVCTASRQSLITGKLPHAVGVTRLPTPLPATAVTLGDWLGDRGYLTAAYGKMHFNSSLKHGFEDRIDTPQWTKYLRAHPPKGGDRTVPWHPFRDPAPVWLNAKVASYGLPDASMEATFFAEKAAEFFQSHKSGGFAMVVSFNEPHSPFKFPDDWTRRFSPDDFPPPPVSDADRRSQPKIFQEVTPDQTRGIAAAYYTSISYLDSKVGQILDALDASGLADDTIVVYLGDNGYLRGHHGRFEKHCFYEQSVRVPLTIRWPKHLPAGKQVHEMVEFVDIMPTLLELAGVEAPTDLQGQSFAKLARGEPGAKGRSVVFSEYLENEEAMVSDGRFKLIVGTGHRQRRDGYVTDDPTPGPYERLYDLKADPNEDVDIASRPESAGKLKELRDTLFDRITTTRQSDDRPPPGMGPMEAIRWCLVPRD